MGIESAGAACSEMRRAGPRSQNRYGGDVEILHLPRIGITGNSHLPFADVNNKQIADVMDEWRKRLDAYAQSR